MASNQLEDKLLSANLSSTNSRLLLQCSPQLLKKPNSCFNLLSGSSASALAEDQTQILVEDNTIDFNDCISYESSDGDHK